MRVETYDYGRFQARWRAHNSGDPVRDTCNVRYSEAVSSRGRGHGPRIFRQAAKRNARRYPRAHPGHHSLELCGRDLADAPLCDVPGIRIRDLRHGQPRALFLQEFAAGLAWRSDLRSHLYSFRARVLLGDPDTSQPPQSRAYVRAFAIGSFDACADDASRLRSNRAR